MRTPMLRPIRTFLLLIAGLLLTASQAAAAAIPHAVVFADKDDTWGVSKVMARFRTRTGVIQLAIAGMVVGLVILMRKFADTPRGARRPPSSRED
jgi:hypothetical protein